MNGGKVYLVGAGPGAADLLSLRAVRLLDKAEVIIYDALLPESFVVEAGVSTDNKELHWLGAEHPHPSLSQVCAVMLEAARAGKTVVRLKNGDPFVFGRGQEEIEYLQREGIAWEVVPGPSAFSSVLGEAGFSLTDRRAARSFAVVSARAAGGETNLVYPRADSLVIYMGVAVVAEVQAQLLRDGWPPRTPVAMIERGCLPGARCITTTLEHLSRRVECEGVESPCLLVIGAAAARRLAAPALSAPLEPAERPAGPPAWAPAGRSSEA
ncbi:uroporphyrinogen-III C-methyltransferase [bacterium]|nr:uroporphyrinogen-III C-methyltransferase [bacterium]